MTEDRGVAPSTDDLADGEDAPRSVRPAERYLSRDNNDHDGFAATMMACQGYAPDCSYAGECRLDGECFDPDPAWRAVRTIRKQADREPNKSIAAGMRRAALLLACELDGRSARTSKRFGSVEGRRDNKESTPQ